MKYRASDDEYVMARVSKAMKHEAATRLAHDWAIVLKLEVKI
jgi:hypothetical protein